MKHVPHILLFAFLCTALFACKQHGCTDWRAENYSGAADHDDGSCYYAGCMDPNALNYNPDATVEDDCAYHGSLQITTGREIGTGRRLDVYFNNALLGTLHNDCPSSPICFTDCEAITVDELEPDEYTVRGYLIRDWLGHIDTLATIQNRTITVRSLECHVVSL